MTMDGVLCMLYCTGICGWFGFLSFFFFFKQKTAYELRISDWSSDVCSSDLPAAAGRQGAVRRPAFRRNGSLDAGRLVLSHHRHRARLVVGLLRADRKSVV